MFNLLFGNNNKLEYIFLNSCSSVDDDELMIKKILSENVISKELIDNGVYKASLSKNRKCVKYLLSIGADKNMAIKGSFESKDIKSIKEFITPIKKVDNKIEFFDICKEGNIDKIKTFIENNQNIFKKNDPEIFDCLVNLDNKELIEYFFVNDYLKTDIQNLYYYIIESCDNEKFGVIEYILNNFKDTLKNMYDSSGIYYAASKNVKMMLYLLENDILLSKLNLNEYYNILKISFKLGNLELIKKILEINNYDNLFISFNFHLLTSSGNMDSIKYILDNFIIKDDHYKNAFISSIDSGNLKLIKYLHENHDSKILIPNNNEILNKIISTKNLEILNFFIINNLFEESDENVLLPQNEPFSYSF